MAKDIISCKDDFPILKTQVHGKDLVYLDNAASTLKPTSVIKRVNDYYSFETANVHRGVHYLSEFGTINFEKARSNVQQFIKAKSDSEIIFTKGTTESINLVADCLNRKNKYTKDDVILLSTMEHHSNIVPWQQTGATVLEIPIDDHGDILLDEYKKLLENNKVVMVAVCHVSNTLGSINPIKEIITLAHKYSALCLIDAAQSIAHMKIDVQDLDCDFLAFSGHKMFAPTGTGILYGKEKILDSLPPYQCGGAMIEKVSFEKTTFNSLPQKFEAGTPHVAGFIGLDYAIEYIKSIGLDTIAKFENELITYADSKLVTIPKLKLIGTAKNKTSSSSFVIENVHPHDLGTLLDRQGIAVRTGHHCTQPLMNRFNVEATTRASFALYNTKEEIDKLVNSINKSLELL